MYERCVKLRAKGMMDELVVARHAQHADEKGMKKFTSQLQKASGERKFIKAEDLERKFMGELNA